MNPITPEEYAKAVAHCVEIAQQGTGGGRVMAQVLLSAYNGDHFQLDITDLCSLDSSNYPFAVTVIRGRYEVRREPQEVIPNGSEIFRELWGQWKRLELVERAKRSCPDCDGGRIYKDDNDEVGVECSRCGGAGRICACGRQ
ncbi:hypothetical protein FY034_18820 (plasmid) [Trichlorobacter lovleyi]|uniref:DUF7673 family protein n=1 Tax=Trichlorobacter lovleyi TaxID=313985 RepID=UPI0022402478|nr:hypothetical protein [Trichlorobacter lovleyi]QOX81031.1 hypothetical protein FY034_18820 [Trichlorobacter lovleyi]